MLLQSPTAPAPSRREPLTLEHPTLALCLLSVIGKTFFELRAASLPLGGRLTKQTTRLRVVSSRCMAGRPIHDALMRCRKHLGFYPKMKYPPSLPAEGQSFYDNRCEPMRPYATRCNLCLIIIIIIIIIFILAYGEKQKKRVDSFLFIAYNMHNILLTKTVRCVKM